MKIFYSGFALILLLSVFSVRAQVASPDSAALPAAPAESESLTIEKPAMEESETVVPAVPVAADSQRSDESSASETVMVRSGEELVQKHSMATALYSLILPGWGEYKMGKHTLGKSLMLTDGLLWAGLGAAFFMRSLIRDDLRATLFAYGDCNGGHSASGRTAWDLTDNELELPLYADSSAYYEERVFKPSRDASMQKIDFYWQWDNEAAHQRYYDLWRSANQAKVAAYYFLGGAVVARVASFVTARYFLKNESVKSVSSEPLSLYIRPAVIRGSSGLELSLRF